MKINTKYLCAILTISLILIINYSCAKKDPSINKQSKTDHQNKLNDNDTQTYRVNIPALILRNEPNTKSKIVTTLKSDTIVHLIQRTENIDTFDKITAPWFQVKTSDNHIGFVFSGYLIKNTKEIENLLITQNWFRQYGIIYNLNQLSKLTVLFLGAGRKQNQIEDITPLKYLFNLKELHLGGNGGVTKVKDITPLKHLNNLEILGLYGTLVVNLHLIKDMKKLKSLFLTGSKVSDLTLLISLTNLQDLDISYTKISDLTPLKSFPNLTLTIEHVEDLTHYKGLKDLKQLKGLVLGSPLGGHGPTTWTAPQI